MLDVHIDSFHVIVIYALYRIYGNYSLFDLFGIFGVFGVFLTYLWFPLALTPLRKLHSATSLKGSNNRFFIAVLAV